MMPRTHHDVAAGVESVDSALQVERDGGRRREERVQLLPGAGRQVELALAPHCASTMRGGTR